MKFVLAVVGLVAVALAHESEYPVATWDPDTAPYFASTGLVYPSTTVAVHVSSSALATTTPCSSSSAVRVSSAVANSTLSTVTSRNSTSHTLFSSSPSPASSTSQVVSESRTTSSTVATSTATETSTRASVPAATGAAVANFPEAIKIMVGGLVAGLAVL